MPLLPGGDTERSSRLWQLAFAAVVIWLGWQGFVNLHRYSAIENNLESLAQELNIGGESSFRAAMVDILERNGIAVAPADIEITFDAPTNTFTVTVPGRWSVDFLLARWERRTKHQLHIKRSEILRS